MQDDVFTAGATHMALVHNSMIRGYNSIVNQVPFVSDADLEDFLEYGYAWAALVHAHHDDEEAALFPNVTTMLKDETIWTETHKEHVELSDRIKALFEDFVPFAHKSSDAPSPRAMLQILASHMEGLREPFEKHMHSEVEAIAALARHPNAPKVGSEAEKDAKALFKKWGKNTVSRQSWTLVSMFFMNLDRTFEDGRWTQWPPMPEPIRWGITNIVGMAFPKYWKFASCNSMGLPRELHALEGGDSNEKQEL